ncbi:MAG: hypothetical protein H6816_05340 [Phycisphaerales bacterium]|nr:hypothetical protein [Phycisphaerales bacterium]
MAEAPRYQNPIPTGGHDVRRPGACLLRAWSGVLAFEDYLDQPVAVSPGAAAAEAGDVLARSTCVDVDRSAVELGTSAKRTIAAASSEVGLSLLRRERRLFDS